MNKGLVFPEPIYVTRPVLPDLHTFTEALRAIWESRWLTNVGPQHCSLEARLCDVLRVPHLSLFNNGTIALITAVQSLRLSGEVITTPFTFPATPHVLTWNGISPIFCDIDPVTMNIDPARIESMITPRTTGILAVHVYGIPCDVAAIQQIADRYGLRVVYDAAHAFNVELDGVGIGTFGDISMFSFHATKLFHTAEGGALTYTNPHLKGRIDLLKNFGIKNEEEVVMPGINGKLNEIQAALGLAVLDEVEAERARRVKVVETYRRLLGDVPGLTLMPQLRGVRESFQYFVIRVDRERFGLSRDEIHDRFKAYNVFTRKYFFPLCSTYTCYHHLPSANAANLPVATTVAEQVLSLPIYGELGPAGAEQICAILLSMHEREQ